MITSFLSLQGGFPVGAKIRTYDAGTSNAELRIGTDRTRRSHGRSRSLRMRMAGFRFSGFPARSAIGFGSRPRQDVQIYDQDNLTAEVALPCISRQRQDMASLQATFYSGSIRQRRRALSKRTERRWARLPPVPIMPMMVMRALYTLLYNGILASPSVADVARVLRRISRRQRRSLSPTFGAAPIRPRYDGELDCQSAFGRHVQFRQFVNAWIYRRRISPP
jgi:hypothetical protein